MAMDAGRIFMTVAGLMLATAALPGCGRDVPIDFHRAVSPCIEMPKVLGYDGAAALKAMLEVDLKQKDADGDGFVTIKEAKANTSKPSLIDESLFNAINPKDGKMSTEDLKKASSTLFKWATYYKHKLLNRFDRNLDHVLTIEEVKGYFNIDQTAFDEADKAADKDAKSPISEEGIPGNGDKHLDPDEFLGLVLHQNQSDCAPGAPAEAAPAEAAPAAAASPAAASAANVRRPAVPPRYAPQPQAPQRYVPQQQVPPRYPSQPVPVRRY